MKKSIRHLSLLCVSLIFFSVQSKAQNFEMQMRPDSISALDFNFRKLLVSDSDLSFLSGNYDLKYRHVFGEKLNAIAGLTYSEVSEGGYSHGGIGNVYLGVQFKNAYSAYNQNAFELGIFLPTVDEEGDIGYLTNYYDLPKYIDEFGIRLSYQSFYDYSDGFSLGYELGPDLIIADEEFSGDNMELLFRYGLNLAYSFSGFQLMSEWLGIAIISEDIDFDDRTIHSYSFGLNYRFGKFVPRVFYKDYFDEDFRNTIDGILGFGFYLNLN